MKTAKHNVGQLSRRGLFRAETFNDEEKSVEVSFSSDEPAMMWNWEIGSFKEILSHDPEHVRLGRMKNGVSVLDNHNSWGSVKNIILGSATDPKIENGKGFCLVRLSEDEDHKGFVQNVKKKIIKDLSVGYRVYKYQDLTLPGDEVRTLKAVDWEPYEVSFVAIPADANAQTRSQKPESSYECEIISREDSLKTKSQVEEPAKEEPKKEEPSQEPTTEEPKKEEPKEEPKAEPAKEEPKTDEVQAEQERCLEINESCQTHGLNKDFARKLITDKTEISLARKMIINKIAEEKGSVKTQNNNVTIEADERDKKRSLVEQAISLKIDSSLKVENEVRQMRNLSLVEMAKELDPSLRMLSKHEIAGRSMLSTSDFPLIFGNVANKSLRKGYEGATRTFQAFARQTVLPDYKEVSRIVTGEAPELKAIAEGGEYEYGVIGEGAEKYKLSKWGRKIRLTEEMFVNDSLDALASLPTKFGNAASRLESKIVYAILTGSHVMSDTKELFHADHGNLGTPGAPSETTLDEMFTKFGNQKIDDVILNLMPQFLIVGQSNRLAAQKLLAAVTASKTGDVNVFQNALQLIVDGNISNKFWFGACSPDQIDTIEYAYLDGMSGPEVKSIADEANDSIILKCKHVFAAKAVEHRGLFVNKYV